MRRTVMVLSTTSLLLPFATLTAQQAPPIEPGARVRVSHTCTYQRGQEAYCSQKQVRSDVGTYRSVRDDTLRYELKNPLRRIKIPLEGVRRIEVVQDQKSRWLKGMGIGAAMGAICGLRIGAELTAGDSWTAGVGVGAGFVLGALVGTIPGGLIGSFVKVAEWEEVPLDQLRVSFAPQRDGRFALGMSVVF